LLFLAGLLCFAGTGEIITQRLANIFKQLYFLAKALFSTSLTNCQQKHRQGISGKVRDRFGYRLFPGLGVNPTHRFISFFLVISTQGES
jgi:hypothetical protein